MSGGLLDAVRGLPGIRRYRRWKYRRRFIREGDHNLFLGVYESFEEARRLAPKDRGLGYDNPAAATMYAAALDRVDTVYYPVLFWLSRMWDGLERVLDFGGHRGVLHYATTRLIGPGPEWVVVDVPAVVEAGREEARRRGAAGLIFRTEVAGIEGADVVVASGCLQYLEETPSSWLGRFPSLPTRLILNATPFHPTRDVVTLSNMGTAYCPYLVRHEGRFFQELEELGYRLMDRWDHPGKRCDIPFHVPARDIRYLGGYLVRQ